MGQPIPLLDTGKLPAATEVQVLGLWERHGGYVTIRRIKVADTIHEFDNKGTVQTEGSGVDLTKHVKTLGQTEFATRALLEAGEAAIPLLVEAARDPHRPLAVRQMAVVILGQVGKQTRKAIQPLAALANDPQLGSAARRAIELIRK